MSNKKIWAVLILIFFVAGASGGFFLFKKLTVKGKSAGQPGSLQDNVQPGADEVIALRFYYPIDGRLELIEKNVSRRTKQLTMAGAVVEEYFRGAGNGKSSQLPQNVKLLGIYKDASQILYVDLSDELRRNFQGDALSEYLLLRGFYESLISNLQDVQDIKILIEGKETETLGGHVYLKYPLKNTVAYEYKGDSKVSDE